MRENIEGFSGVDIPEQLVQVVLRFGAVEDKVQEIRTMEVLQSALDTAVIEVDVPVAADDKVLICFSYNRVNTFAFVLKAVATCHRLQDSLQRFGVFVFFVFANRHQALAKKRNGETKLLNRERGKRIAEHLVEKRYELRLAVTTRIEVIQIQNVPCCGVGNTNHEMHERVESFPIRELRTAHEVHQEHGSPEREVIDLRWIHSRDVGADVAVHLVVLAEESMRFVLGEAADDVDSAQVRFERLEHSVIRPVIRLLAKFLETVKFFLRTVRRNANHPQASCDNIFVSFETIERHGFCRHMLHFRNKTEVAIAVTIHIFPDEVHLVFVEEQRSQSVCVLATERFKHFLIGGVHVAIHFEKFTLGCAL